MSADLIGKPARPPARTRGWVWGCRAVAASTSAMPGTQPALRWLAAAVLLILTGGVASVRASSVISALPSAYAPGVAFPVTNQATPDASVTVYAVQDMPPVGWTVDSIGAGGTFDPVNHTVKWGPFYDAVPRVLSYRVTPPAGASGAVSFSGLGMFDQVDVPITGQRQTVGQAGQSVVSSVPSSFVAGVGFVVTNLATPATGTAAYAVEDTVPPGWWATNVNAGGVFDAANRAVKWGPFFDAATRVLTYVAVSPAGLTGTVSFTGAGDFDGVLVPITGQRQSAPSASLAGTAVSALPQQFTPGQWFMVTNLVTPDPGVQALAVEDRPPAGWLVTNVSNDGTYDSVNSAVKWGPIFGHAAVALTYAVLPPAGANGTAAFSGSVSFDDLTLPITGRRQTLAAPAFHGTVVSMLPATFVAGVPLLVTNQATPGATVTSYAVEDTPPAGWTVSAINQDGTFDAANHAVKWGPFYDALPRMLSYQVTPPAGASGTADFSGQGLFDNVGVPIGGQRESVGQPRFVGSVVSQLPARFVTGAGFWVTNLVTPATNTTAYAVEDTVPPGWWATNVSAGGVFDPANRTVKWGPFFDAAVRQLSCLVVSPTGTASAVMFAGNGDFDGVLVPIGGRRQMIPSTFPTTPLTVTGITANDRVYDGTRNATLNPGGAVLVGFASGDIVTLSTASAIGTFADKAVGTGKAVAVSGLALGGPDAANYTLIPPGAVATITTRTLTVTGIKANDKVYDGTTSATLNTGSATLIGVVSGDVVTLNTSAAIGAFADPAVGVAKTVTMTGLTLNGFDAVNYSLAPLTATADILPSGLTITKPALAQHNFSLSIATVAGTRYVLESTRTLTPPAWASLGSVTGTGGVMTLTDTNAAAASQFYRIRIDLGSGLMINAPALAAGAFTLSISTVAGTQYTLEATSTLTPVAWTPLQSVTGTGAAMTLVDGHAAGAMKFYRVRVGGP